MIENKTPQDRLATADKTIDIMLYGQPDIRSARITNDISRRKNRNKVNKAK